MSNPTGPVGPTNEVYGSVTGGAYVAECYDSPTITSKDQSEANTHVKCIGYTTTVEAFAAISGWVNAYRPSFHGLYPDAIDLKPIAPGLWDANISYRVYQYDEQNLVDAQFNTAGGTDHIECSYHTPLILDCETGEAGPSQGGAINVQEDGTVQGLDVKAPAFSWSQTQNYSLSAVNHSFKAMLASYTNCVNSVAFRGFAIGEVMFDGASGVLQTRYDKVNNAPTQYWRITFSFTVQANTNEMYAGVGPFQKNGWDYRWVKWNNTLGSKGKSDKTPGAVFVEQIYRYKDLNQLPIINIDPGTNTNAPSLDEDA